MNEHFRAFVECGCISMISADYKPILSQWAEQCYPSDYSEQVFCFVVKQINHELYMNYDGFIAETWTKYIPYMCD